MISFGTFVLEQSNHCSAFACLMYKEYFHRTHPSFSYEQSPTISNNHSLLPILCNCVYIFHIQIYRLFQNRFNH